MAVAAWTGHAAAEQNAVGPNGSISIVVDHVHDNKGHVRVDICTQPTFLKAECPYSGASPAVKGVTTVVLTDVPPGVYAAQIYHDRNDNHTVDRRFGIPIEEIGFSNNAPVGLHGPKFEHAAFVHDTTDQNIEIKLRRFE
ncbi:MAG: DUF2141 domain-containing protein [Caulobacteraceae bacterium]